MEIDFTTFFNQYEILAKAADKVFEQVQENFPEEVTCKLECSDCCHAMFDISLIEALYLNHKFKARFSENERKAILEKANRADRKAYKVKRQAYKQHEEGKAEMDILLEMAGERVRCPLLNEKDQCDLYESRPITCRFYGVPTDIAGIAHTCGKSGFIKGKSYPTVHLEKMQQKLQQLSHELVAQIHSRYSKLGDLLVPVSMALLTDYNDEYLGIGEEKGSSDTDDQGVSDGK